ncbi:MAG: HlyD family efflux transporter periplasmic adaptor subunit [Pirellulaceae bacterium]
MSSTKNQSIAPAKAANDRQYFKVRRDRNGSARVAVIAMAVVAVLAIAGVWGLNVLRKQDNPLANALTAPVVNDSFLLSVVESGDVESSSNVEIRCQVKSQGRAGSVILEVIPEGSEVKQGDFLCQLDDSLFRDQLVEQRIQVAKDRAAMIQAESDLATSKQILVEYENGVCEQELAALQAEVATANESLRRARDTEAYSRTLNRKGFVTKTQLDADQYAVEKAKLDLDLAIQKLEVYERFTRERTLAEYKAEIEKQGANLEAAQFTLELSQNRTREIESQIEACRILAPNDGQLVYANEVDRRGDASFVIEEGATLRDGQPIFFLPDPNRMQVRAAVNDSKINMVEAGQQVTIRLDSQPEIPIRGEVARVAPYPLPRRWFQAPIEYEVVVTVLEQSEIVRPGLRAKVEILVQELESATQVPVASIFESEEGKFVFVKTDQGLEPRRVETDSNNEQNVIVSSGVESGEEVLVDPESYREFVELPTAS